jgi:hypothetical protein
LWLSSLAIIFRTALRVAQLAARIAKESLPEVKDGQSMNLSGYLDPVLRLLIFGTLPVRRCNVVLRHRDFSKLPDAKEI